ncbi:4Fe-4S dicluster domain-containing protein [Thermodesulfobacteriota bacterium]
MIKRPFFGLSKPKLEYPSTQGRAMDSVKEIPLPSKVTLLIDQSFSGGTGIGLNLKDKVNTGQKIVVTENGEAAVVSTVTGTVSGISDFTGYLGRKYSSITIETADTDQWAEEKGESLEHLSALPGNKDFASLLNSGTSLDTIVVSGFDNDILVTTNQFTVKNRADDLKKGIEHLKKITKTNKVILIVPQDLKTEGEKTGTDVKAIGASYPDALPAMIMKNVLGKTIPAGKTCRDMGIGFINAESVAALGKAIDQGRVPVSKMLTVIDKGHKTSIVEARVGTPIKDILETLSIKTNEGDRLVLGGPMTGTSVYTEDMPILFDTDAVMIQDSSQIVMTSDNPCINCGECVRVCPTKVPVNMLVRLLENGLYEEAVEEYDLLSCIECGLCSYVCIAKIPLFQYIMLGKSEFDMIKSAEESNA